MCLMPTEYRLLKTAPNQYRVLADGEAVPAAGDGAGAKWAESGGPVELMSAAIALEEHYNASHFDDTYHVNYFKHSWAGDLLTMEANFCAEKSGMCLMPTEYRLLKTAPDQYRLLVDGEAVSAAAVPSVSAQVTSANQGAIPAAGLNEVAALKYFAGELSAALGGVGVGNAGDERKVGSGSSMVDLARLQRILKAMEKAHGSSEDVSGDATQAVEGSSFMGGRPKHGYEGPWPPEHHDKVLAAASEAEFDAITRDAAAQGRLVVVDFWAVWCENCKHMFPAYAELADEYAGKVVFVKVDKDANGALSKRLDVGSIPAVRLAEALEEGLRRLTRRRGWVHGWPSLTTYHRVTPGHHMGIWRDLCQCGVRPQEVDALRGAPGQTDAQLPCIWLAARARGADGQLVSSPGNAQNHVKKLNSMYGGGVAKVEQEERADGSLVDLILEKRAVWCISTR